MDKKDMLQKYMKNELDLGKLSKSEIKEQLDYLETIKKVCNEFKKKIEEEITKRYDHSLTQKRKEKPFGSIVVVDGDYSFTETLPRKVKWDQKELKEIYNKIKSDGEKPEDYMNVKYNVSEKGFSDMKTEMQTLFKEAREVSYGAKTIKIKMKESK